MSDFLQGSTLNDMENILITNSPKAGYPQPQRLSCRSQLSALEVILKFESLEVWKRSSRLCADLYKHFQDIKDFARFLQYSKGSCGELRTQI